MTTSQADRIVPVYRVKGWDEHFEGAKSRTYKNKSTCQMPTKHGLGYRKLIRQKNGPALFGAWCALVQVLSRQTSPRQGYCTDTGRIDGRPYTSTDLEMLTDIPEKVFVEMLQVASSKEVAWLGIPDGYHADTEGISQGGINSDSDLNSNSNSTGKPIVELPFDSDTFAEAWKAWKDHRKAMKKPMTPRAQELALKKLPASESDAIQWIEHAIEKGWQGIYEPKSIDQHGKTTTPHNAGGYDPMKDE